MPYKKVPMDIENQLFRSAKPTFQQQLDEWYDHWMDDHEGHPMRYVLTHLRFLDDLQLESYYMRLAVQKGMIIPGFDILNWDDRISKLSECLEEKVEDDQIIKYSFECLESMLDQKGIVYRFHQPQKEVVKVKMDNPEQWVPAIDLHQHFGDSILSSNRKHYKTPKLKCKNTNKRKETKRKPGAILKPGLQDIQNIDDE